MPPRPAVVPLVAMVLAALLAALYAGLLRIGWVWPPLLVGLPAAHGPLMVSGVLGTVIGIERAVALGRSWPWTAPALSAVGTVAAIWLPVHPVGPALTAAAGIVLVAVYVSVLRRHRSPFMATMAVGALCWAAGSVILVLSAVDRGLLGGLAGLVAGGGTRAAAAAPLEPPWWLGMPVPAAVPWWIAFLLLTVAGERFELARIQRPTVLAQRAFGVLVGGLVAGAIVSLVDFPTGMRWTGAFLAALAAWLLRFDIARRTVRADGVARFAAAGLLTGYGWLAVAGALAIRYGGTTAGPLYDATLHAFFVGFVLSMLMAHAPFVVPAVLGLPLAYRSAFYVPLAGLSLSLALRLAGDLAGWQAGRAWGGLLNALVLLLFLGLVASAVVAGRRAAALRAATAPAPVRRREDA